MKTVPDALYTAKSSSKAQNTKKGPDALGTAEKSPGAQNMKTGSDALDTIENECGRAKHEIRTRRPRYNRKRVRERKPFKRDTEPSVPPKTSPGAQNMKTEHDAHCTAQNEFGSAKHENGSRRPRYRRKRVRECKT
jgi:hypothetical protein